MFCSDFPHAEGLPRPLADYQALCGPLEGPTAEQLYGGNVDWLLGTRQSG
jgi:hypothetical protein